MKNMNVRWQAASLLTFLLLSQASAQKVIKLATLLPLSGTSAEIGKDMHDSAALAVQERQGEFNQLGYQLELQAFDDAGSPVTGVKVVQQVLADPGILGVVGAQASGVCLKVGEVLAQNPVAMVSPTCTADELTAKGWKNFYRVTAPSAAQAGAAAEYIAQTIKPRSVFVVTENTTYGNSLTKEVQQRLRDEGVNVAGYLGASTDQEYQKVTERIAEVNPDVVFFGGIGEKGAKFLKLLRAAGVNGAFVGGTSLDQPDFYSIAGKDAEGAVFVSGFGPSAAFAQGTKYNVTVPKFKREMQVRGLFAYDAMNVLLDAVKIAAQQDRGAPTRNQVVQALRRVNLSSNNAITGPISFTATGERRSSPIFVMKVSASLKPEFLRVVRYRAQK